MSGVQEHTDQIAVYEDDQFRSGLKGLQTLLQCNPGKNRLRIYDCLQVSGYTSRNNIKSMEKKFLAPYFFCL